MKPYLALASFLFDAPALAQGIVRVPGDAPTIDVKLGN